MKVKLKGGLVRSASPPELELIFGREVTLEEFLQALSARVPDVERYLLLRDELGGRIGLLILVNGNWLPSDGMLTDTDAVEIYPPISGGL